MRDHPVKKNAPPFSAHDWPLYYDPYHAAPPYTGVWIMRWL